MPRLLQDFLVVKADGRYPKLLRDYAKADLIVLDDDARRDPLNILDDRHGRKSTLATSDLPVDTWLDYIGDSLSATYLI